MALPEPNQVFHVACTCRAKDCAAKAKSAELSITDTGAAHLTFTCEEGHINKVELRVESSELVPSAPKPPATLRTKVSGVTFENPDGTSRQELLKRLSAGDSLKIAEAEVEGRKAYLVRHAIGVIGTLRRDLVSDFLGGRPDSELRAKVLQLTGGQGEKPIFGCNIELFLTDEPEPAPSAAQADGEAASQSAGQAMRFVFMDPNKRGIYHADRFCSGMKTAERVAKKYAERTLKARPCKRCVKPEK